DRRRVWRAGQHRVFELAQPSACLQPERLQAVLRDVDVRLFLDGVRQTCNAMIDKTSTDTKRRFFVQHVTIQCPRLEGRTRKSRSTRKASAPANAIQSKLAHLDQ